MCTHVFFIYVCIFQHLTNLYFSSMYAYARQAVDVMGNQRVRNFLQQFVRHNSSGSTNGNLRLTPVEDLRQAIESDASNLGKVQGKITKLMREWSALVFKKRQPALRRLGYGEVIAITRTVSMPMPMGRNPAREADENNPPSPHHNGRHGWNYNGDDIDDDDDDSEKNHDRRRQKRRMEDQNLPSNMKNSPPHDLQEEHQEHLREMHLARRNLENSFQDPLPETIAAAERAAAPQRRNRNKNKNNNIPQTDAEDAASNLPHSGSSPRNNNNESTKRRGGREPVRDINQRKKSAQSLHFDDSDDDDYETVNSPVKLSELPTTIKNNDSNTKHRHQQRSPSRSKAPTYSSASGGAGGKRKRFTDEEKRAIRKGVERHGVGKWAEIKADFAVILRSRSNVQIKVRTTIGSYSHFYPFLVGLSGVFHCHHFFLIYLLMKP